MWNDYKNCNLNSVSAKILIFLSSHIALPTLCTHVGPTHALVCYARVQIYPAVSRTGLRAGTRPPAASNYRRSHGPFHRRGALHRCRFDARCSSRKDAHVLHLLTMNGFGDRGGT
jgi:hypothetical protein